MKKLKHLFIFAAIMVFAANAFAQHAKDSTKYSFITIDGKGSIHNHSGTKLGYITKDNVVKDNQGHTLYFIDRDGNVLDTKGNKLGKAAKNGNYYNNNGEEVLQLKNVDDAKCEILDPKGHSWGYAHKNYKLHACAAHCFFLEQKKLAAAKKTR
ncbi:5-fold beta-flower protein [Mucilaginibacter pocheonensis]|uniref:WG containing repeat-containing protein n=1 Tax=Mucilaginibacter pocheonensis TaxID=398050 RepID=A0ABU1TH84_9SPHI|nr:DUF3659 domain-containing protein [Mucilaginibacter pocheonensis]MDR6944784.1 hypothetical protein [Mucilaginibacter pocheonensis]